MKYLRRSDPLFAFTPAAWVGTPVRSESVVTAEEASRAAAAAGYLVDVAHSSMRSRMEALSAIQIAAMLLALCADQVCPGNRPASAGDLLTAAAYRADSTPVSVPRSLALRKGVHEEVARALETRDEEIAILVLVDIMLLIPEVLQ